jgi:hypothetical protein
MIDNQYAPISKEHELHAQVCMDGIWDFVAQSSRTLAAHEIIGILETVKGKIVFDHNVRQANEEVKRMRDDNKASQIKVTPIIDKNGFPFE